MFSVHFKSGLNSLNVHTVIIIFSLTQSSALPVSNFFSAQYLLNISSNSFSIFDVSASEMIIFQNKLHRFGQKSKVVNPSPFARGFLMQLLYRGFCYI